MFALQLRTYVCSKIERSLVTDKTLRSGVGLDHFANYPSNSSNIEQSASFTVDSTNSTCRHWQIGCVTYNSQYECSLLLPKVIDTKAIYNIRKNFTVHSLNDSNLLSQICCVQRPPHPHGLWQQRDTGAGCTMISLQYCLNIILTPILACLIMWTLTPFPLSYYPHTLPLPLPSWPHTSCRRKLTQLLIMCGLASKTWITSCVCMVALIWSNWEEPSVEDVLSSPAICSTWEHLTNICKCGFVEAHSCISWIK